MDKVRDDKSLKGPNIQSFDSGVGRKLKMKDVCWYGEKDLNKNGKIGATSWDSSSYVLMMAHNVYNPN